MGYRYDTRHLKPQVQQIINKRDENDKLVRDSNKGLSEKECYSTYPLAIFMRLGYDKSVKLNGVETLQVYEQFCSKNNSVWFSTDSLAYGMAEKKSEEFIKAIRNKHVVEIYFAIGQSGGGKNGIVYRANVLNIISDGEGINSPDKLLTPDKWKDDKKKIWIKIHNLMPFDKLTTADFLVASTGNVLANSIARSEYHFGYIKKK